jgi:hypothetical protein
MTEVMTIKGHASGVRAGGWRKKLGNGKRRMTVSWKAKSGILKDNISMTTQKRKNKNDSGMKRRKKQEG